MALSLAQRNEYAAAEKQAQEQQAQVALEKAKSAPGYKPPVREIDLNAYLPIYQKAFSENLRQPGAINLDPVRSGTATLIQTFNAGFQKVNKRLPTTEETEAFLAENLTPGYAAGILQGTNQTAQANQAVSGYLQANPLQVEGVGAQEGIDTREQELRRRLDAIYPELERGLGERIRASFIPQRERLASEEAALGRLRSPASITTMARVDDAERQAMTQGLGQLAANRAQGELGIAGTIESILQAERAGGRQESQFARQLGLQNRQFRSGQEQQDIANQLQRQELSIADQIGRAQAKANKPGTLDYINTGFGGLAALGGLGGGAGGLASMGKGIGSSFKKKTR